MMARPTVVPNVAKAVVPTAAPQACARRVRTAEAPAASTAAITSSGIAAWVKPVPKWMAEAIAKVAASAVIAIPILRLGMRRRVDSCAGDVEVMVSPVGRPGDVPSTLRTARLHVVGPAEAFTLPREADGCPARPGRLPPGE